MNLREMLTTIEDKTGPRVNDEQKAVIAHENGPLWVIAGPGSGKSEVLVLRTLKLVCVDEVPAKSIILTTFTEKAARNIEDRLALYKNYLDQVNANLRRIDLSQIRVGTLHSLCNNIMHEYRYVDYQNYRLLDAIEQLLFVDEHSDLSKSQQGHLPLWQTFDLLTERYNPTAGTRWNRSSNYPPHRWIRVNAAVTLFNRIVEDRIDVSQMHSTGGIWKILASAYEEYRKSLEENKVCDFAHLQLKFLEFLESPNGRRFIDGDTLSDQDHPGISHVLVDEYQDTNPIQENIYLRLAQRSPHNLCVVGDDDQALYRFRGGTVECMVNFDSACQSAWGAGVMVHKLPLSTNYRSHPKIVDWCDTYIQSFPVMTQPGARVSNKPSLSRDPQWGHRQTELGCSVSNYPAVSYLLGQNYEEVASRFAEMVKGLLDNGIVNDPSQCVLLLRSTRLSPRAAQPYQEALQDQGLEVYNPRSRTFLEQPEIQTALGTLVKILDPNEHGLSDVRTRNVRETVENWIQFYTDQVSQNPELSNYVKGAINRIRQTPANETVTQSAEQGNTVSPATIPDIFYHMISLEPFVTWRQDVEQDFRLGKLSQVLESYCMLPFSTAIGSTREILRTGETDGLINSGQLGHLYYSLVGLLVSEGLNDPEDEEIICPQGSFPIMTVHQAKGLEFPFVFVSLLGNSQRVEVGSELQIEDTMRQFRNNSPQPISSTEDRAEQDRIRLFYVAYSRAIYSLVFLARNQDFRNQGIGFGDKGIQWFTDEFERL